MRVLAVVLAGCGRIGFGDGADGGVDARPIGSTCTTSSECGPCASCAGTCQPLVFDKLIIGQTSTIGIAHDGSYWGWGGNMNNDLALTGSSYALPQPLPQLAPLTQVVLDYYDGAGIAADGTLWAWGGGGTSIRQVDGRTSWSAPSGGWSWGGALRGGSQLATWGDNYDGNLGDGTNNDSNIPVDITLPPIRSFSAQEYLGCAIDTSGGLWCWGQDENGQVGIGAASAQQATPARVGTDTDWVQLDVGGQTTCARKSNGTLWCWGQGYFDGTVSSNYLPAQIGTRSDWVDVASHFSHTCGITADRALWCWGSNLNGELGVAGLPYDYSIDPVQVALPGPVDSIEVGGEATCALVAGTRYCWGNKGALGVGSFDKTFVPFARCP